MAWKRVKRQEEEKFHGRKISRDSVTVKWANTGGFATLHVRDKYFGGFAVNSKSGFA